MMRWLMRLLGREERDPLVERVEDRVNVARSAISASQQATTDYWLARRKELRVVDHQVDARRRESK